MKKAICMMALAIVSSACVFGQVDRSKEVKPTVSEHPAVEHTYSCPFGYELKYFVPAPTSLITATYAVGNIPLDHYDDAPAQDIMRSGVPTCVPQPNITAVSGTFRVSEFVFPTSDGKAITIHIDSGHVDIPEGYSTDKAAKEFWEALTKYAATANR